MPIVVAPIPRDGAIDVVLMPNVEKLVCDYLRPLLTDMGHTVTVATNVPATRPAELVKVTATGGQITDIVVAEAQVAIECWAASPTLASDLARICQALLNVWEGQPAGPTFIYSSKARNPASFPDPDTRTPRYIFTLVVLMRGQVLAI